jgi:hypothetical protein
MHEIEQLSGDGSTNTGDDESKCVCKNNRWYGNQDSHQPVADGVAGIQEYCRGQDNHIVERGTLVNDLHRKAIDGEDVGVAGHDKPEKPTNHNGDPDDELTPEFEECCREDCRHGNRKSDQ